MDKINTELIVTSVNNRTKIYFALKIFVAVLLLVYLLKFVDLKNILLTFTKANFDLLAVCFVLLIPNIILQYWKWKITCNALLNETNSKKIIISLFYGFPAAVFTPGRAGEYFGRGLAFKHHHLSEVIIATAVDKFFTMVVTFITGTIGMIIFIDKYYETSSYLPMPLMISFILFVFLGLAFLFSKKVRFLKSELFTDKPKWMVKIYNRLLVLNNLDQKFAFKMLLISFLFFFCYVFQFVLLIYSFTHHGYFVYYFLAALVIMFSKSILAPISVSELGVREGAAVFFLTQMGESSSAALNASLLLFVVNILIPSLIGLILLFMRIHD